MGNATIRPLPEGIDPEDWPRRDDVPYLYRTTISKVQGLMRAKRLIQYQDHVGVIHFDPSHCQRWLGQRRDELLAESTRPKGPSVDNIPQGDELTREAALEMLLREMTAMFRDERVARTDAHRQMQSERESLLKLVLDPAGAFQKLAADTIHELRDELTKLRQSEWKAREAQQTLLDRQAERDIELYQVRKREDRRDRAASQLSPHLVGILQKLGISTDGTTAVAQLGEIREWLGQVDTDALRIILEDPNTTDAQRETLYRLRPDLKPGDSPQPNGVAS